MSGCFSLLFSIGVIAGVGVIGWLWITRLTGSASASSHPELLVAAQNAFNRGDLSGTISLARQVLIEQPEEIAALRLLARALIYRSYAEYNRAADRETALEATTDAFKAQPLNADVLAIHAFALQADGQVNEAAEVARRVLEKNPQDSLARTAMSLAYGSAGAHEVALRESQHAVQTANADTALDALRALSISYSDMGSYTDAIRTVDQAIAVNGNILALYFERAQYDLLLGDTDSATVAYFQVLTHDNNNVKARLRLCELSSLLRERDQAIRYCEDVTHRAPGWWEGWYRLGMEYFLQGNFDKAQHDLNRCSTLQVLQNVPNAERRFECWYIQGQAAEIRGDCDSLISIYNEFRLMAADQQVQQRWTYPPEGPPQCTGR